MSYYFCPVLFFLAVLFVEVLNEKSGPAVPVRVSTGEYDLTIEATYDENGQPILTGGIAYQNLQWLAQQYNYQFVIAKFYEANSIPVGALVNESWTGVMGDLTKNVADIGVGAFGAKAAFNPYVEMTFPWGMTSFSMFIPYPHQGPVITAFLKPLSLTVWFVLLISLLATAFTLWVLVSCTNDVRMRRRRSKKTYGTYCMCLVAVLTGQGGNWNYSGKVIFTLGTTWCLSAVVIVNAYNGLLTSYLLTTNPRPLVSSLEDLASKSDVPFYTFDSWALFTLKEAKSGVKKILGDGLRKHPERILPTYKACLEKVAESSSVCFSETSSGDIYIQQRLEQTGECRITNVARDFLEYNPVFLVQKNSSFFPSINKGIIWAHATGFESFWNRNSVPKQKIRQFCQPPRGSFTKAKKLTLQNLSGTFLILIVGYLAALVVFAIENIAFKLSLSTN